MIAMRTKRQVELFTWYQRIINTLPKSSDKLFDIEAEYQNDKELVPFLVNSAYSIRNSEEARQVMDSLIDDYLERLNGSVVRQKELYDTIISASNPQLCQLIEQYDWEVSGGYEHARLDCLDGEMGITVELGLSDDGYVIVSLRIKGVATLIEEGLQAKALDLLKDALKEE